MRRDGCGAAWRAASRRFTSRATLFAALGVLGVPSLSFVSEEPLGEPLGRAAVELEALERDAHHAATPMAWAEALPPLLVRNVHNGAEARVRLYRDDGDVDANAVADLSRLLSVDAEVHALDPRVLQLVAKAAYHFRARAVLVVSAYRPQKNASGGSRHATGEALDFKLEGVRAPILAAELRSYARVGVGIYTHPKTQFVHLDVRAESFHWLDGSPPGVSWREKGLPDFGRAKRDAAYSPDLDLPFITAIAK